MAKATIEVQRDRIDEYKKIIDNIRKRYKNKRMPEYQSGYIAGLEGRIVEMEQWIEAQKGREDV